jgi:NAD(P)-dependent dehydrogenase (short-subunit alcohol dehydrogenase family)
VITASVTGMIPSGSSMVSLDKIVNMTMQQTDYHAHVHRHTVTSSTAASLIAHVADEDRVHIAVSKSAAIHLTASLAKACRPEIAVNCVSPGVWKTDWAKSFFEKQLPIPSSQRRLLGGLQSWTIVPRLSRCC